MARARSVVAVVAMVLGLTQTACSQGAGSADPAATAEAAATARPAAERQAPRQVPAPWWLDKSITTKLGLDDDQLARIKELMAGNTAQQNEERRQERHASMAFLRALNQDPYDPALVDQRSTELSEILSNNQHRRVANVRALRDIVTHEQWMMLWEVAPQALKVSRFQAVLGPKIHVTADAPVPDDEPADDEP